MESEADMGSEAPVNLETDFEQSIDDINSTKLNSNGIQERKRRSGKNPNYRDNSDSESSYSERNGYLAPFKTKKKKSKNSHSISHQKLKSGSVVRKNSGGKPFSHQMRESGMVNNNKIVLIPRIVVKTSGKPRSMMLETMSSSPLPTNSGHNNNNNKRKINKTCYYQSQITEDKNTIKMKIKKAASVDMKISKRKKIRSGTSVKAETSKSGHHNKKHRHQNAAKHKSVASFSDEEQTVAGLRVPLPDMLPTVLVTPTITKPKETKKKAPQTRDSKTKSKLSEERCVVNQSPWGSSLPTEILSTIFHYVVLQQGALPSLVKLGEVCRLWHAASVTPQLWHNIELSQHTKDKWKTDHRLVWLMENRLSMCQQLNLSNWKVSNILWVMETLVACCPNLEELNLTGWKRLGVDHLRDMAQGLAKLGRLDLSCTSEASSSGGCLSVASLTQVSHVMGERLTHLTLANNKMAGLPVILNSIADHCPNLKLLDLSNLWAVSHPAMVPLERLQKGCSKLKVLRITNSQVVLATATTQDQVESPGFPLLEELSVACPSVDYKLVDDEALGRILKSSTCLKLLDVRGCIRITDSGLVKVPAWDLQHLFLSGCAVTRQCSSCLELICEKWSHSLVEVDLAWATATQPLNAAVDALADKGLQSKLRILNLCGSSVSLEPVRRILIKCPNLESVNLASCRALPRGMKRHYVGRELEDLRDSFDPVKKKEKEDEENLAKEKKRKSLEEAKRLKEKAKEEQSEACDSQAESSTVMVDAVNTSTSEKTLDGSSCPNTPTKSVSVHDHSFSPQASTSGISTPSSQVTTDPTSVSNMYDSESKQEATGASSSNWSAEQGSPLNKQENVPSSQPSPSSANAVNQDTPMSTGSWSVGNYSPSVHHQESPYSSQNSPSMMRQESPYSQRSPYSSQIRSPSIVRQESPYSSVKSPSVIRQESPYSSHVSPSVGRQESPYSSHVSPSVVRQESPYSSHVSPSIVRQESPYSSHVSPSVPRQESPYSSHVSPSVVRQESPYSSHMSPSVVRQESPYSSHMSPSVVRQESPYSSQKSPYTSQKSPDPPVPTKAHQTVGWGIDQFSPVLRQESASSSQPSPETSQVITRPWNIEKFSPMQSSAMMPSPDTSQVTSSGKQWNLDRFSPMTRTECSPVAVPSPEMSNIKATQSWNLSHPSPDTGQISFKGGWNIPSQFNPVIRPEQSPTGPMNSHLDTHKTGWSLNQFNQKVDSCSAAPNKLASAESLVSPWPMGSGVVTNKSDVLIVQRTGGVSAYSASDQVTTTTYCANPVQNIYRNYRDPINGPSTLD